MIKNNSISLLIAMLCCIVSESLQATVRYSSPLAGKEQVIGNLLEWKTAEEANSELFVVERSIDGIEYDNIGVIDAAGKSINEKGYRFLDINATTVKAFYRLRQIDVDGSGSLSQIVMIKRRIPNQFAVINMTNTSAATAFQCNIHLVDDGVLEYTLLNLQNDVMQHGEQAMSFGINTLEIPLSNEAVGIYVLQLKMADELESLVIRRTEEDAQTLDNVAVKDKNK